MKSKIVVIGAGPVGIRAVEEIAAHVPDASISLYGDEPGEPYNRAVLTNYLAGQSSFQSIRNLPNVERAINLQTHFNCAITALEVAEQQVHRADGMIEHFDKLVLATGSRPYIPRLDNTELDGVFTLRTLADADFLKQRAIEKVVVVGGGLLGLESAKALCREGKRKVTVIDHAPFLMSRQLNKSAGDLLREKVLKLGIEVALQSGIKKINGTKKLESIQLKNNRLIECDTLIFATGIKPNIDLAKQAGIRTRNGIVVDEHLQTSVENIYAVGECAEFDHITFGTLVPGLEQARIMAANLGGEKRRYHGSLNSTRFKVLDYPVFSMGRVGQSEASTPDEKITFDEPMQYIYRQLVIYRGRLVGCVALGEWPELSLIRAAIENNQRIWPWELKRFSRTGSLWLEKATESVIYWPKNAVVCNCSQVTQGQLMRAVQDVGTSPQALSNLTKAGTVCGGCLPLLSGLRETRLPPRNKGKLLRLFSLLLLLAGLLAFQLPDILNQQFDIDWCCLDVMLPGCLFQQNGAYVLLLSSMLALVLSFRKGNAD
jgi:NAD(P)H-nitrite reductase large subunit